MSDTPRSTPEGEPPAGPVPAGTPPTGAGAPSGPSPTGHPPAPPEGDDESLSSGRDGEGHDVESLVLTLELVTAERDEYLRLAQEKQAELENFRKRVMKQQVEEVARASGRIIDSLLPVLDAFDYGVAHGSDQLAPMRDQLLLALEKEGLVRLDPTGDAFDPNEHEAVAHEPGDGEGDLAVVAETLRAGYRWQGQLLRPVMVKVRG